MFGMYKPLWGKKRRLKSSYDAVIIGGGLHGLATAYFLAKEHGITDVAIIEKRFIGFGGAGRNTAIVRANQRTQYNVPLYKEALDLWPVLTKELDFNLMFNNCGNLNLMHSEAAMKAARMTIATAQFHGVESHLIDAKEAKELVPALNISEDITFPIHGAMFHPPGGIVRHDAVVWGLAKGCAKHGVHIHQHTEATAIHTEGGKITGVETSRGRISTNTGAGDCRWLQCRPHLPHAGHQTAHQRADHPGHGHPAAEAAARSRGLFRRVPLLCQPDPQG